MAKKDEAKKQANYILKTVGINIPGYDRSELKVGRSVTLEEEVGDKFTERGFLVKASAAKPKSDKASAALKKENESLKQENKTLLEQLEEATKPA